VLLQNGFKSLDTVWGIGDVFLEVTDSNSYCSIYYTIYLHWQELHNSTSIYRPLFQDNLGKPAIQR